MLQKRRQPIAARGESLIKTCKTGDQGDSYPMKKHILTIAMLLASGIWLSAQQNPASSAGQAAGSAASQAGQDAKQAGQAAAGQAEQSAKDAGQAVNNATKMKVKGCLSGSDGNYTLTDNSGTAYQLSGDTSKLSSHVGHEIQVTGTTAEAAASAVGSTPKSIEVTNFKASGTACPSAAGSKPPQK